jgi:hypothetical protein
MIIATTAWEITIGARLDHVDEQQFSVHKPGLRLLYTSEELESVLLYRALSGVETSREARNVLSAGGELSESGASITKTGVAGSSPIAPALNPSGTS